MPLCPALLAACGDHDSNLCHNRPMIKLQPTIDRIKALLEEDTEASITYAALEARLALEKVCYDRLRQRHDYISHDQLRKWQPGGVINTLISDVDAHLTETMTLSMSKTPASDDVKPEDEDYVEIGTEVGFDAKKIVKMWNAVARLALHVRLPKDKNDHIPDYGDKAETRAKVLEVVAELERLAKGTMTFSGIGMEVSFDCSCGTKNKRREKLLREGQHIHCISPDCKATWKVTKEGEETVFESVTADIDCDNCGATNCIPWRFFWEMKYDEHGTFSCHTCRHKNYVKWQLALARRNPQDHAGAG
ncbi:hypothetical protein LWE61_17990 [Sphingobium sufflavum]|uniref:hypothetical protein n=1 Tax=Sphingobium sufflavum TaxID=1129547 RepID=UPI001F1E8B9F|nr:hypothetical protein [Sphingobium sufflavum]MCE7798433.1 hypothetical protein [Sphingobium sufflavum]